jgi:hypothetical protein
MFPEDVNLHSKIIGLTIYDRLLLPELYAVDSSVNGGWPFPLREGWAGAEDNDYHYKFKRPIQDQQRLFLDLCSTLTWSFVGSRRRSDNPIHEYRLPHTKNVQDIESYSCDSASFSTVPKSYKFVECFTNAWTWSSRSADSLWDYRLTPAKSIASDLFELYHGWVAKLDLPGSIELYIVTFLLPTIPRELWWMEQRVTGHSFCWI